MCYPACGQCQWTQKIEILVKAHMVVDTEEYILKKTRNDQNDVEHGFETVEVLWDVQKANESEFCTYTHLLQSRLLLGWRKGIWPITRETRLCLCISKTRRLGRIVPVEGYLEQGLYLVNG